MNFLKNIISSAIGFIMAIGLCIVFVVVIAVFVAADEVVTIDDASVLKIELETELKDYAPAEIDPFSQILGISPRYMGLNKIISAIKKAQDDPKIKGISIEPTQMQGGISQLNSIRNAIADFKDSGKFVMAYADVYGQKEYFLSSVADSVFVSPVGEVEFKGLSSEILFFKDFQDKYGVKMEVIRHGKYKSAVEPFLENEMSLSNKIQLKELLNSLWEDIVESVSISRNIPSTDLNKIADELLGRTAELSETNKLVDALVYKDDYDSKLKRLSGGNKVKKVSLSEYLGSDLEFDFEAVNKLDKIAVVYAQGSIIYGEGDEDNIGQGMLVRAIEKAKKDSLVKAIVLRVNSPGGSALASDLIWRALDLAQKEKPLIVSMGNYAASGGYYISCNADKIFAESSTITGSIGVFGMLPNASELTSKMGINSEKVSTNKSPSYSVFQKIDPEFYEVTKQGVDRVYKTFVAKVAKGRNMRFDAVHELAQGRVWSGKQAVEIGLVDEIGSLDSAIRAAVSMAGVVDYKIKNYPSYDKDIRESFQKMPFFSVKENVLKEWLGDAGFRVFSELNYLKNREGIQMGMPYVLDLK